MGQTRGRGIGPRLCGIPALRQKHRSRQAPEQAIRPPSGARVSGSRGGAANRLSSLDKTEIGFGALSFYNVQMQKGLGEAARQGGPNPGVAWVRCARDSCQLSEGHHDISRLRAKGQPKLSHDSDLLPPNSV
jgi:hypothetical protein